MENDLKDRTKRFAIRIIQMANALPYTDEGRIIKKQVIRSGTSTAANYRASCRAQSPEAFLAKMSIVEEEADESLFWLEIIRDRKLLPADRLVLLIKEADEIVAIIVSSKKKARSNRSN